MGGSEAESEFEFLLELDLGFGSKCRTGASLV
jgi:hypothetical protein